MPVLGIDPRRVSPLVRSRANGRGSTTSTPWISSRTSSRRVGGGVGEGLPSATRAAGEEQDGCAGRRERRRQ